MIGIRFTVTLFTRKWKHCDVDVASGGKKSLTGITFKSACREGAIETLGIGETLNKCLMTLSVSCLCRLANRTKRHMQNMINTRFSAEFTIECETDQHGRYGEELAALGFDPLEIEAIIHGGGNLDRMLDRFQVLLIFH